MNCFKKYTNGWQVPRCKTFNWTNAFKLTATTIIELNIQINIYIKFSLINMQHYIVNFNKWHIVLDYKSKSKVVFTNYISNFHEDYCWVDCCLILGPMNRHDILWEKSGVVLRKVLGFNKCFIHHSRNGLIIALICMVKIILVIWKAFEIWFW